MEKIDLSKEELRALVQSLIKEGLDKIIKEEPTDIVDIYGRTIAGRIIRIEERMATKEDIKNVATKDDVREL